MRHHSLSSGLYTQMASLTPISGCWSVMHGREDAKGQTGILTLVTPLTPSPLV